MTGTHPRSSGIQWTWAALLLYPGHQQHMHAVYLVCALHTCGRPWWSSHRPDISKMLWASTLQLRLHLNPWPPGLRAKLQLLSMIPSIQQLSYCQNQYHRGETFTYHQVRLPAGDTTLPRPCRLWTTAVCWPQGNTSQKIFASGCWFLINHSWLFSPT